MKVFFDTSVLIAAFAPTHKFGERAQPIVGRALNREFEWFVSQHTVAELYRVITAMPGAISPLKACKLIENNIYQTATIVSLNPEDYLQIVKKHAKLNNRSGSIFDALIAHAAQKIFVDHLYTFNTAHFLRVWPEGATVISEP